MGNNAPCKACTERHPGCHGVCEKYMKYTEERQEINSKRAEEQKLRYRRMGRK